jgi:hypothetical protein
MKKILLTYLLLCAFFFADWNSAKLYGKTNDTTAMIYSSLEIEGFENITVSISERTTLISYENRIYRSEAEGAAQVIKIIFQYLKEDKSLVLIPKFRNIPMITIKIPFTILEEIENKKGSENLTDRIEVSMNVESYYEQITKIASKNSTKFKADIIVSPQMKARFGNFDKIAETQINIAPELRTSLWKGMSFSAQAILPLHNELDSLGNYVRPGLVTVNQLVRLPFNTFASGTLGYFTENRLGVDLEIKSFFLEGKFSLGASLGYTQETFYSKDTWYYSDKKNFTHLTSASYRNPQLDLNFKVSYGKFLMQDKGWRFDIARQFGETEIGFYGTRTNFGNNAGFNFSIPIFPSKYWKIKSVRIRPTESFPWEYRYKFFEDARTYNSGNRIDNLTKKFNPDFFKKELILYLKKNYKL